MSDKLLNNPAHKLQSVVNHTLTDSDKELPPAYVAAIMVLGQGWDGLEPLSGDR
jgi:hypothetical protein